MHISAAVFLLLCICSIQQALAALDPETYARSVELHPDVTVFWQIDGSVFRLGLQALATGWVGFGIAEVGGMAGADIVYFEAEGNKLVDAHALEYSMPISDECQDWTLVASSIENGTLNVEVSRALDTGDDQDWALIDDLAHSSGTNIIAAWGDHETIQYHSSKRVRGTVRLFGDSSPADSLVQVQGKAGVQSAVLQHDGYLIPTETTVYHRACFDLADIDGIDASQTQYILAIEPIIDPNTRSNVHHFTIEGYYTEATVEDGDNLWCDIVQPGDGTVLFAWASGGGIVFPDGYGLPILGSNGAGYRSFQFTTHFDNPENTEGLRDNSGVRIWFSSEVQIEIGIMALGDPRVQLGLGLGQESALLPPGRSKFTFDCTRLTENFEAEQVTALAHGLHMHEKGKRMAVTLYDTSYQRIRRDSVEVFDFSVNGGFNPLSTGGGFKISKGDTFKVECFFDVGEDASTRWGLGSLDEMCIDFLFYAPRQPLPEAGRCALQSDQAEIPALFRGVAPSPDLGRRFGNSCSAHGFTADGLLPFETAAHCSGVSSCVRSAAEGQAPTQCEGDGGLASIGAALEECFSAANCCGEWPAAVEAWGRLPGLEGCQGVGTGQACPAEAAPLRSQADTACPAAVACLESLPTPASCEEVDATWRDAATACFESEGCCMWHSAAVETVRLHAGLPASCAALFGTCEETEDECASTFAGTEATWGCEGIEDCLRDEFCPSTAPGCAKLQVMQACGVKHGCCDWWEQAAKPGVLERFSFCALSLGDGVNECPSPALGASAESSAVCGGGVDACLRAATQTLQGQLAVCAEAEEAAAAAAACFAERGCCSGWADFTEALGGDMGLSDAGCAWGECRDEQRKTLAVAVTLPMNEAELTAEKRDGLRQACAEAAGLLLAWVRIVQVTPVASARRRLLSDSVRVDLEMQVAGSTSASDVAASLDALSSHLTEAGLPAATEVGAITAVDGDSQPEVSEPEVEVQVPNATARHGPAWLVLGLGAALYARWAGLFAY